MYKFLHVKCPLFLSDFHSTCILSVSFSKNTHIKFHENPCFRHSFILKSSSRKIRLIPTEIEPATCRLEAQFPQLPALTRALLLDSGELKLFRHYFGFQVNRKQQQTTNSRDATEQNDTRQKQKKSPQKSKALN